MTEPTPTPVHPLEPFSAGELTRAVAILRESGHLSDAARFSCALPIEPLASAQPKRLDELKALFMAEAEKGHVPKGVI